MRPPVGRARERLRSAAPWIASACLAIPCAALAIANFVRLVPYATVWGDLATWTQALLTGGGLLFASVSVLLGARQLRGVRAAEQDRVAEVRDVARRGLVLRSLWTARPWLPSSNGLLE